MSARLEAVDGAKTVTDVPEMRFESGSWSGTCSLRYTRRLPMLQVLFNHPSRRLSSWARQFHDGLVEMLENAARRDRSIEAKFEQIAPYLNGRVGARSGAS